MQPTPRTIHTLGGPIVFLALLMAPLPSVPLRGAGQLGAGYMLVRFWPAFGVA